MADFDDASLLGKSGCWVSWLEKKSKIFDQGWNLGAGGLCPRGLETQWSCWTTSPEQGGDDGTFPMLGMEKNKNQEVNQELVGWWLVVGWWWLVVGDSCLVWGVIVFTQDLSLQLLAQARMACWICWRIRPMESEAQGMENGGSPDENKIYLRSATIPGVISGESGWFWLCVILRLQHLPSHLGWEIGKFPMKFDSTTGGSKHGARARAETGSARGHRSGSGGVQWMRFQRKAPREGEQTDQLKSWRHRNYGKFATGVLVLELIHTVYIYIYNYIT